MNEAQELITMLNNSGLSGMDEPFLNINLQAGEKLFFQTHAALIEEVVYKEWVGRSSGMSFRVARGVSYRVGGLRGHQEVTKRLEPIDSGVLSFTNRRIIYTGKAKNLLINFDKYLSNEAKSFDLLNINYDGKKKEGYFSVDNPYVCKVYIEAILHFGNAGNHGSGSENNRKAIYDYGTDDDSSGFEGSEIYNYSNKFKSPLFEIYKGNPKVGLLKLDELGSPAGMHGIFFYNYVYGYLLYKNGKFVEAFVRLLMTMDKVPNGTDRPSATIASLLSFIRESAERTWKLENGDRLFEDYYAILQVSQKADPIMISTAYKTIMHKLKAHPDLGGEITKAQLINEAYGILSDKEKREAYDLMYGILKGDSHEPQKEDLADKYRQDNPVKKSGPAGCPICGKSAVTVHGLVKHIKGGKKSGGHEIPLADAERMANEAFSN